MISPKELYYQYTTNPCEQGSLDIINRAEPDKGAGTPYDLTRLASFLKQIKYPCFNNAPFTSELNDTSHPSGIMGTGSRKLGLPFKFLQRLDIDAFTEIQPDIKSGTSHAIRNACDVMRACYVEASGLTQTWEHRGATEYLRGLGDNNITDCLMLLGPDLVDEGEALFRGTGCGALGCLPTIDRGVSALSAEFRCALRINSKTLQVTLNCTPCKECESDTNADSVEENKGCCSSNCETIANACCGDVPGYRTYWFYPELVEDDPSDGSYYSPDPYYPLRHIGLLKRKSYGGYVNLINNSGPNLYSCPGDLLLKHFQSINNYDYKNHSYKVSPKINTLGKMIETIDRVRTISLIQNNIIGSIKDLLYNGYGVVMMTNVGFPNTRDSTGLTYPDRIWYHSYAIIGYDDRKADYDECVFLLANSWGKWNDGGHPNWGPIPDGSFLVTETHLQCMLNLYRVEKRGCRKKQSDAIVNPENPNNDSCISTDEDNSCGPWSCAKKQRSMGMVFALSITEGFPRQILDYSQFYKVRESIAEPKPILYFDGR